jgi:hypothetical protein
MEEQPKVIESALINIAFIICIVVILLSIAWRR